jgi:putative peptidoglycan lipid II flippase
VSDAHRFVAPARLIAALTMLSRVLGLVREMLYAFFFGSAPALSSFTIAWQIPNLSRRLFGEGALSAAFIPLLTDSLQARGREEAQRLAGTVYVMLAVSLSVVVVLVELGILAVDSVRPSLTLRFTAVLIPYMPLICVTAVIGGTLNVLNRFASPAFAPVLLNVFTIAAAAVGGWLFGLRGVTLLYVVCGTHLAGGVAQLALVSADLRRAGFRPRLGLEWRDPAVRQIAVLMAPMVLGMSAVQLNTLADSLIALFFVPDGRGPAVLRYAHVLYQLPLGVLGVALATAIFPLLSANASKGDRAGLTRVVEQGIRMSLFVGVPSAVGLCLVAGPLVRALFERGAFVGDDAARATRALIFYGAAVWAYFVQQILVRSLYALKDSRSPARVAVYMVMVNLVLNLALVLPLREAGVALATAISAAVQSVWLFARLRQHLPELRVRWLARGIGRIALATIVLAVAVCGPMLAVGAERWRAVPPVVQLLLCVALGIAGYTVGAKVLGIGELRELTRWRRGAAESPPDAE